MTDKALGVVCKVVRGALTRGMCCHVYTFSPAREGPSWEARVVVDDTLEILVVTGIADQRCNNVSWQRIRSTSRQIEVSVDWPDEVVDTYLAKVLAKFGASRSI